MNEVLRSLRAYMSPKTAAWVIVALLSIGVAVWVNYPRTKAAAMTEAAPFSMTLDERKEIAEAVPTVPLTEEQGPIGNVLSASIVDPHKVLSDRMRLALVETLKAHLLARAHPDSSAYLKLVESEHTKWIGPDDERRWRIIYPRYKYITEKPPQRDDPRGALATVMDYGLKVDQCQLVGLGTGEHGVVIHAVRVRSAERIVDNYLTDPEATAYWFFTGYTGAAIAFRVPLRSFEEVVARDGAGVFVQAAMLVRTTGGRPILLDTRWYWDPAVAAWQCAQFHYKGPYRYVVEM
jgi:hypothetical protein